MTEAIAGIISDLELRRAALDKAITALREIDDDTPPAWVTSSSTAKLKPGARKGKKRSAAARKRMAEAQRRRWQKVPGK